MTGGNLLGDDDDDGDRVAKCQIFYTDKNLSSKFYPKRKIL